MMRATCSRNGNTIVFLHLVSRAWLMHRSKYTEMPVQPLTKPSTPICVDYKNKIVQVFTDANFRIATQLDCMFSPLLQSHQLVQTALLVLASDSLATLALEKFVTYFCWFCWNMPMQVLWSKSKTTFSEHILNWKSTHCHQNCNGCNAHVRNGLTGAAAPVRPFLTCA